LPTKKGGSVKISLTGISFFAGNSLTEVVSNEVELISVTFDVYVFPFRRLGSSGVTKLLTLSTPENGDFIIRLPFPGREEVRDSPTVVTCNIKVLYIDLLSSVTVLIGSDITESEDLSRIFALELFDFEYRVGLDSLILL
jgi:hypothetical protein